MAAQHNLLLESGTDFETLVYIGVGDSNYTFTGKDYRAKILDSYGGGTQYAFTITEDSTNKAITISMYESVTKLIASGTYVWDLIENTSDILVGAENAFVTTNGQAIVKVIWTAHKAKVGDRFTISGMADPPGGYSINDFNGTHTVTGTANVDTFSITMDDDADATETDGDADFSMEYKTTRLLEGDVLVTPRVTGKTDGNAST